MVLGSIPWPSRSVQENLVHFQYGSMWQSPRRSCGRSHKQKSKHRGLDEEIWKVSEESEILFLDVFGAGSLNGSRLLSFLKFVLWDDEVVMLRGVRWGRLGNRRPLACLLTWVLLFKLLTDLRVTLQLLIPVRLGLEIIPPTSHIVPHRPTSSHKIWSCCLDEVGASFSEVLIFNCLTFLKTKALKTPKRREPLGDHLMFCFWLVAKILLSFLSYHCVSASLKFKFLHLCQQQTTLDIFSARAVERTSTVAYLRGPDRCSIARDRTAPDRSVHSLIFFSFSPKQNANYFS